MNCGENLKTGCYGAGAAANKRITIDSLKIT
jgi:hypothetical protein